MANTRESSGTQTAVIGTEHVLVTPTGAGNRVLKVDLSAMANGDVVELVVYDRVLTGDTAGVVWRSVYRDAQLEPIVESPPVPQVEGDKFALKQTVGTGRAFKWAVILLG